MKKVDFSKCRFIKEQMWFYTLNDFCENRHIIKHLFKKLDNDGKLFYMWYVYANINMPEKIKNYIWEYLNNDDIQYEATLVRYNTRH